jgi:hypothetical protein
VIILMDENVEAAEVVANPPSAAAIRGGRPAVVRNSRRVPSGSSRDQAGT